MSPIYGQLLSIKQRVKIRGTGRRDNNERQQKKTLFGSVQKGSCDACDGAKCIHTQSFQRVGYKPAHFKQMGQKI